MKSKAIISISLSAILFASTLAMPASAAGVKSSNVFNSSETNQVNPFAKEDIDRAKIIKSISGKYEQPLFNNAITNEENNSDKTSFIVKFKSDISFEEISSLISGYQYKIIGASTNRLFTLTYDSIEKLKSELAGKYDYVEQNRFSTLQITPDDPKFSLQWALDATKIPDAWEISTGASDVIVAMIDSGVSRTHEDLAGADIRDGWDFVSDTNVTRDVLGHGTETTGVIAATANNAIGIAGVCWKVVILPFQVFEEESQEASTSDICDAIIAAADAGADIINLSLGASYYQSAEYDAITYAATKGCIIVAAAGNGDSSDYSYPASYPGVISAASIDKDLSTSSFSNYNNRVDAAAPGGAILTTYGEGSGYRTVSGTSFSSPYIAGIAALARAYDDDIDTYKFSKILKYTSMDMGSKGYDNNYGYGIINAENVLKYIQMEDTSDFIVFDYVLLEYNGDGGNVIIPDGVTKIDDKVFFECAALTGLTLPDSVTSIGDYAFSGCANLKSCAIPSGVTSIGAGTFSGCLNLKSLTIPSSVTTIGADAFHACPSLNIYGFAGSFAQAYADAHSIPFFTVTNLLNFVVLTSDGSQLTDVYSKKVSWFTAYKKASLQLGYLTNNNNYGDPVWTSSNSNVMVDTKGYITNLRTGSRSADITIRLTDNNGVEVTDTVRVVFYKFSWQLKKLSQ